MATANMRRNTLEYATMSYLPNLFILTCKKMSNIIDTSATFLHNFLIQVKNFASRQSLRFHVVIYNILLIVFLLFLLIKCRNKCRRTKGRDPSLRVAYEQVDALPTEGSSKEGGQSQSRGVSKRQGGSQSRGESNRRGGSKTRDGNQSRGGSQSRSRNQSKSRNKSRSGSKRKAQITNKSRATIKGRARSRTPNTSKGRNASKEKKPPKSNPNRSSHFEEEKNVASRLSSLRSRARNQNNVQRENSPINTKPSRRTGIEMTHRNKMVTSNSLGNVSLPYVDISNAHLNLKEKEKKKKATLKEKKKN
ncbi:hypothetical protein C922_02457 [Plasmodium inui San Antonio 1]|uniref:Uncharacterized protein n=1 Tax=Plasmodium inui San Antonio 1 TaxID=1237626 RepID=W7A259_9APIC|nr:hypothetical protein C922_02457 [Plasmodium inui San Antonio 1]EUD67307.1 hypothetical protein C922_02457 [Plasmodium inui San Antonio 1]